MSSRPGEAAKGLESPRARGLGILSPLKAEDQHGFMDLAFDLKATWVPEACLGLLDFWFCSCPVHWSSVLRKIEALLCFPHIIKIKGREAVTWLFV